MVWSIPTTFTPPPSSTGSLLGIHLSFNPEVLAVFGHESENARAIIQAKDLGIPPSVVRVCPSAAASKEFPEIGGEAVTGTIFTAPFTAYNPDPKVQEFVKFGATIVLQRPPVAQQ